jgi:hypothetical protein
LLGATLKTADALLILKAGRLQSANQPLPKKGKTLVVWGITDGEPVARGRLIQSRRTITVEEIESAIAGVTDFP